MTAVAPRRFLLLGILAVALAVRVGAAVWWQWRLGPSRFAFGDSESYWVLGQKIARGEPYQYGIGGGRVFRTPGYPLLLAGLFAVAGDDSPVLWARLLGAVLGTLAVACVFWLARVVWDDRIALVAAALAALYPGAIGMSVFVLSEALFCPLMLLQLVCWLKAWRSTGAQQLVLYALLAGAAAGAATLARPGWLLFTPLAALVAVAGCPPRVRQLSCAVLMLVGLTVVMAPWWIRNYRLTGHWVLTTLQTGASLYDGLNPEATGASDMRFVERFYHQQLAAAAAAGRAGGTLVEVRLDRRLRNAALSWAVENPGRVIELAGIKLVRMWSPWPHAEQVSGWRFRLAVAVGYVPLALASLWGLWCFGRRGWPVVLCLLPAVYLTLLHMVFVSSIRYRQPPMLALVVLAAAVVGRKLLGWPDQRVRAPGVKA